MTVTVVVAGRTAPNRAVRFGGEHDDLDRRGRRDVARVVAPAGRYRIGPEASVVQTAEILGVRGEPDRTLASLDVGRWRGLAPEDVLSDLRAWFVDPDSRPHGGETIREFVTRIRSVVRDGDSIVVASPVAQALLCVGADGYFGVDVRPGSVVTASPGLS